MKRFNLNANKETLVKREWELMTVGKKELACFRVFSTLMLRFTKNKSYSSVDEGEDPGLRIESFAVINLRGISINESIICFIAMQTYKELIKMMSVEHYRLDRWYSYVQYKLRDNQYIQYYHFWLSHILDCYGLSSDICTLTQFLNIMELSDVPESITMPGLSNNLTCLSNWTSCTFLNKVKTNNRTIKNITLLRKSYIVIDFVSRHIPSLIQWRTIGEGKDTGVGEWDRPPQ
jgi:hypothetical protein